MVPSQSTSFLRGYDHVFDKFEVSDVDGTKPSHVSCELMIMFLTILGCLMAMGPSQSASLLRGYDHIFRQFWDV